MLLGAQSFGWDDCRKKLTLLPSLHRRLSVAMLQPTHHRRGNAKRRRQPAAREWSARNGGQQNVARSRRNEKRRVADDQKPSVQWKLTQTARRRWLRNDDVDARRNVARPARGRSASFSYTVHDEFVLFKNLSVSYLVSVQFYRHFTVLCCSSGNR